MNYRHSFHAGNFADVFKHIILIELIQALLRKDTPFFYLDTHAGIGRYDLLSGTQKNKEYIDGIERIRTQTQIPDFLKNYLDGIQQINRNQTLQFYPGSPFFVKQLLRSQDRMVLAELHPDDYQSLKKLFAGDKQIAVHHQDGYQALKAFLPPKEKRGVVLIDPPYESPDELIQLPKQLEAALSRWETGIYAIWYPIKNRAATDRFHADLKRRIDRPMLTAELCIYPDNTTLHLNGCGMTMINPPWQLEEKLAEIIPWLWRTLSHEEQGRYDITS